MARSDRRSAGRDGGERLGLVLVVLLVCYVPVVAASLCQVQVPLLAMAAAYVAPLVVALLTGAWQWHGAARGPAPVRVPAAVPVLARGPARRVAAS